MDICIFESKEQDISERMAHGLRADATVYIPFDGMNFNHGVDSSKSSVNRREVLHPERTAAQSVHRWWKYCQSLIKRRGLATHLGSNPLTRNC